MFRLLPFPSILKSFEFSQPLKLGAIAFGWILLAACNEGTPVSETADPASSDDATAVLPVPPPPPSSAFIALLSPEQTAQIKSLDVPLVVPTAIPAGFTVERTEVMSDDRFASYRILYRDDRDRCFLIEHASGGVSAATTTENRASLELPILDNSQQYGLNYGRYADGELQAQFAETVMVSDWLPLYGHFYRLAGAALINAVLNPSPLCQEISVEEAVNILESLALITDEITGDGPPGE